MPRTPPRSRLPSALKLSPKSLIPAVLALLYPGFLDLFHFLVGVQGEDISGASRALAEMALAAAFAPSAIGIAWAVSTTDVVQDSCESQTRARRLALATVATPALYTMLGVMQALAGSRVPDEAAWAVLWLAAMLLLVVLPVRRRTADRIVPSGGFRVAHGVSALILVVYVVFHLTNHLLAWKGEVAHAAFMNVGRRVYRSDIGEPVLVAAMLFQIFSGLVLAWRWSAVRSGFFRTFQIASGFYLAVYIAGHMNSVFVYARAYLGIPTGWDFATGAPNGLIHDGWSVRLIPHYALAVFFVIAHLGSAVRVILIAHGIPRHVADRVWAGGAAVGFVMAFAILMAMSGMRLREGL